MCCEEWWTVTVKVEELSLPFTHGQRQLHQSGVLQEERVGPLQREQACGQTQQSEACAQRWRKEKENSQQVRRRDEPYSEQ